MRATNPYHPEPCRSVGDVLHGSQEWHATEVSVYRLGVRVNDEHALRKLDAGLSIRCRQHREHVNDEYVMEEQHLLFPL
jgi:hypothetical protein